jgi:hypothetical protein
VHKPFYFKPQQFQPVDQATAHPPLIHALFAAFPQTGRFSVHSEPASNQPIFPPIGTGASDF